MFVYDCSCFCSPFVCFSFCTHEGYGVYDCRGGMCIVLKMEAKYLTWFFQSPRPTEFSDLYFINSLEGYVTCDNTIYRTNNGGNTWERVVYLADGGLFELHFTDKNHGWAVGARGTILIFKR